MVNQFLVVYFLLTLMIQAFAFSMASTTIRAVVGDSGVFGGAVVGFVIPISIPLVWYTSKIIYYHIRPKPIANAAPNHTRRLHSSPRRFSQFHNRRAKINAPTSGA